MSTGFRGRGVLATASTAFPSRPSYVLSSNAECDCTLEKSPGLKQKYLSPDRMLDLYMRNQYWKRTREVGYYTLHSATYMEQLNEDLLIHRH
ncbi:hypothetical protein PROFUN_03025 [Planoprotostelium fungivorum]|uniref:Uncharacterized protein n=1 Tax=Planoprotostelium fungivorum TaxID=1890364 RepID=A0A2P6NXD2_9EUKA|nr:hypothetical protein PROFUN_03025 [Planoprotostelium fungivorum]